jgi:hypothetical protein
MSYVFPLPLLNVQIQNTAHLRVCASVDYGLVDREIEIGKRKLVIWDEEEWEITLRLGNHSIMILFFRTHYKKCVHNMHRSSYMTCLLNFLGQMTIFFYDWFGIIIFMKGLNIRWMSMAW